MSANDSRKAIHVRGPCSSCHRMLFQYPSPPSRLAVKSRRWWNHEELVLVFSGCFDQMAVRTVGVYAKQLSEPPDTKRRIHLELDYLVPWNKTISSTLDTVELLHQ